MAFTEMLDQCGIAITRSCKRTAGRTDTTDASTRSSRLACVRTRFKTLGELVAEIYRTVWDYNNTRIHSALNMPPLVFPAAKH